MARLIEAPTEINAAGNVEKIIQEFIGRLNTKTDNISIAKMNSPEGWEEPGQTPEFDEFSIILKGTLRIENKNSTVDVKEGQAVIAPKGEWIKYSTPFQGGAEYIAICIPAFSPDIVHRDE